MNNFYVVNDDKYTIFEEPVIDLFNNSYYEAKLEVEDSSVRKKENDYFERINQKVLLSNGDCEKVLNHIYPDSVDLVLTDPPYNLGKFMHKRNTNLAKMRKNHFAYTAWDNLEEEDWIHKMDYFIEESGRVLKKGGALIIFMAVIKVETIIKLAQKHGFYYKTTGVWHKTNPMPRNMNLHFVNSTESWVYFVKNKATGTFNNEGKLFHDYIETSVTNLSERKLGKHPTQKPLSLMAHFVKLLSNKGDVVLDPFMGSGTTGVVSNLLNRNFIGIELDKEYFELSKKRIINGK
jgi:DNA modification methylase